MKLSELRDELNIIKRKYGDLDIKLTNYNEDYKGVLHTDCPDLDVIEIDKDRKCIVLDSTDAVVWR